MTIEAAKKLCKGDYVMYDNKKYKVLNIKEMQSALSNEKYVEMKCCRGSCTMWLSNNWVEPYSEES